MTDLMDSVPKARDFFTYFDTFFMKIVKIVVVR